MVLAATSPVGDSGSRGRGAAPAKERQMAMMASDM